MALFDIFKGKSSEDTSTEENFTCEKCGKVKKKSEGNFVLGGSTFCCKECCGDPSRGEHKQKKDETCEFC
jgi:hypothetical protein